MNNTSITRLADVTLYSRLVKLFGKKPKNKPWLIEEEATVGGKWEKLSVREAVELMDTTKDVREIRAIALFSWMCDFYDKKFVQRILDVVADKPDAILEAALFNSQFCVPSLYTKLCESLRHVRRKECLEHLIVLHVLWNELSPSEKFGKTVLIGGTLSGMDPIQDIQVFIECIRVAQSPDLADYDCAPVLQKLVRIVNSVPSYSNVAYGELAFWGISLLDQLKIAYLSRGFIDTPKSIWKSKNKRERLCNALVTELFSLPREWTESERGLAQGVIHECNRMQVHVNPKVVYDKNVFAGCIVNLQRKVCLDHLNDKELLCVITDSLDGLTLSKVSTAYENNRELFARALVGEGDGELWGILHSAGCQGLEAFKGAHEKYLSLWQGMESYNWVVEHGMTDVLLAGMLEHAHAFLAEEEERRLNDIAIEYALNNCTWALEYLEENSVCFADEEKLAGYLFPNGEMEDGELPFPVRAAITRNEDLRQIFVDAEIAEYLAAVFWLVVDRKVEVMPVEKLLQLVDEYGAAFAAFCLRNDVGVEDAEKFPSFIRRGDARTLQDDSLSKVPWVPNFWCEPWHWRNYSDAQKRFVIEFAGMLDVRLLGKEKELLELRQKSGEHFMTVAQMINDGAEIAWFAQVEDFENIFERMFGNLRVLVDSGIDASIVKKLQKEYPQESKTLTLKELPEKSVLRLRGFYGHCDFSGMNLDTLAKLDKWDRNLRVNKQNLKYVKRYDSKIITLYSNTGIPIKELKKFEKYSEGIASLGCLGYSLLRGEFSRLQERYGLSGEVAAKAASYVYRWDEVSLAHIDFIIGFEVHGALEGVLPFVIRKHSSFRKLLSKADKSKILYDRVITLAEKSWFDDVMSYMSYYDEDSVIAAGRSALYRWLCGNLEVPKIGQDFFGDAPEEIINLVNEKGVGLLEAVDWAILICGNACSNICVNLWLNIVDGSWLEHEDALYRVLRDQTGVCIQCISGEDKLDKDYRRVSGKRIIGITSAPVRVDVDDTVELVY